MERLIKDLIPNDAYLPQDRKIVWDMTEKAEPDLWRQCYPRVYSDYKPGEYANPKEVARQMFSTTQKIELGYMGDSEKYEIMWASRMAEKRTPMYWVTRDMVEAVMHTTPPIELDWYNMQLPYEAAAFMIPKGMIAHPKDGEVQWVAYSRSRIDAWIHSLARRGPKEWSSQNGAFLVFAKTDQYLTHWNMPYDQFPVVNLKGIEEAILKYEDHVHSSGWLSSPGMDREDTKIGIQATHLIFGLLLLMTRRPELISSGQLLKKVPAKKNKEAREFWTPPVIGREYKIKRVTNRLGGTHASPRYHWVRGHWKEQPYGPGRASVKEIWVEPYERAIEE